MTGQRPPERVVVVGGGISGLTAALRLSQAGSEVTVVEPGPLGGKLQTSVFAGRPVDESADAFLLRVPWALGLCHDLELDGELISPAERTAHVFVDGVRRPLPVGHVLGVPTDLDALAATGIVSPEGLARVARDLELGHQPTDPLSPDPATNPARGVVDDGADSTGRGDGGNLAAPAGRIDLSGRADVAIGPYLRGRLGDEVVDHLIDPLVGGINAGDTATLSLAAVVPQLDAAARSGDPSLIRSCAAQRERALAAATTPDAPIFATPLGGMARLVDGLLGFLPGVEIRQGRRVVAIEPTGSTGPGGPRPGAVAGNGQDQTAASGTTGSPTGAAPGPGLRPPVVASVAAGSRRFRRRRARASPASAVRVVLDDGTVLDADVVVVATPAHAAAPLLGAVSPEAADLLGAIEHASISMVTLAFDRADLGDTTGASGCLLPRDQGTLATAVSYATSKWAQLRDPDRDDVILRASAGRFGDKRHLELDDAALTEAIVADLDRVLGVTGAPTEVRVGRWPASFPQYAPGHLQRIDALDAALATTPVRVAGMALRGVGIPACIRSAEEAASSVGATWPTRRSLT